MSDVRKERVEQRVVIGQGGLPQRVFTVFYRVGDDGPFSLDFTEAEFTPEMVRERMEQVARTIRAL